MLQVLPCLSVCFICFVFFFVFGFPLFVLSTVLCLLSSLFVAFWFLLLLLLFFALSLLCFFSSFFTNGSTEEAAVNYHGNKKLARLLLWCRALRSTLYPRFAFRVL